MRPWHRRVRIVGEAQQPPAQAAAERGTVFGYLGVEINGTQVWTLGGATGRRYLGPLLGARAAMDLQGMSPYGVLTTMQGIGPHLVGSISVTAGGACYQRALRPGALVDATKIEAQIARFNALADAVPYT
jgi:hypothetical protein